MQLSRFRTFLFSLAIFAGLVTSAGIARAQEDRPKITGISHIAVYTSDPAAAQHFYGDELGAAKQTDPEDPQGTIYRFREQFVEILPLPTQHSISRLDHVAFATSDVDAMHGYLVAHQYRDVDAVKTGSDGSKWFFTRDPEGNRVEFYQAGPFAPSAMASAAISTHIIHVGYLVKNRAAEDRFYRDLLGFRPYWYGAMHPGKLDWVSQQVPDGHDWLEYMMTGSGSDSPDTNKVDARQLGVMNHFSLGVPNMEKAVTALYVSDAVRFSPRHDGPTMGKDGKWQANLYDPDGTRVELMEFQPVMKPCCSDFTASSPAD
jgi:catechol 2,3-dioxygenase-like lactoylglutathione lyase family enzyme